MTAPVPLPAPSIPVARGDQNRMDPRPRIRYTRITFRQRKRLNLNVKHPQEALTMKKLSLFLAAALIAPAMASAQDAAAPDAASYPRCSASVTDHCTEGGGMGMGHHKMMKHGHKHGHKHGGAKAKK